MYYTTALGFIIIYKVCIKSSMTERESVNFSIDVMGWFGGVNYREKKKKPKYF